MIGHNVAQILAERLIDGSNFRPLLLTMFSLSPAAFNLLNEIGQ